MSVREEPNLDQPQRSESLSPEAEEPADDGDESTIALPRPLRSRIGWTRPSPRTVKLGILVAFAAVALGGAAVVGSIFYEQYGAVRNEPNAAAWAGLTTRFAGAAACASCHAEETRAQDASIHVDVACESCHGSAAAHSASAGDARLVSLVRPTSAICQTCHAATSGRPASFPQIVPGDHFSGGQCLRCHDPHSIVAVRPPTVSHPLDNLPACTSCHAPDGLKSVPEGHEVVEDRVCLSCHGPAAGGSSR